MVKTTALRAQPPLLIAYVSLVIVATVAASTLLSLHAPITTKDVEVFGALAFAGVLQDAIGRRVERVRRRFTDTSYINLTSIWTFAGTVVLPAALIAGLTVLLYTQLTLQTARSRKLPLWRSVMNCAFVVLTCDIAHVVLLQFGPHSADDLLTTDGLLVLLCALIAYFLIGVTLTTPSIWVRTRSLAAVVGSPEDNILELSTLCLGAVLASGLIDAPLLSLAVIPPTAVLHRGLLGRQTESVAFHDAKTDLLTPSSWQWAATQALLRDDCQLLSVLMVDLDHFKSVNDTFGHLAGDDVLRAVARCVADQVRQHDSVGRFGGEEFVALLPSTGPQEATIIAERIRQAVCELQVTVLGPPETLVKGLTVSIGVAHYPEDGDDIAGVLRTADTALYQAKADGRNRVVNARRPVTDKITVVP